MQEQEAIIDGTRQSKRPRKVTELFKESYQELKSGSKKPSVIKSDKMIVKKGSSTKNPSAQNQWHYQGEWLDCLYPQDDGQTVPLQVQFCVSRLSETNRSQYFGYLEEPQKQSKPRHDQRSRTGGSNNRRRLDKKGKQPPHQQKGIMMIIQNLITQVLGGNQQTLPRPPRREPARNENHYSRPPQKRRGNNDSQYHDYPQPIKKVFQDHGIVSVAPNENGLMVQHTHYEPFEIARCRPEPETQVNVPDDLKLKQTFETIKLKFKPLILQ